MNIKASDKKKMKDDAIKFLTLKCIKNLLNLFFDEKCTDKSYGFSINELCISDIYKTVGYMVDSSKIIDPALREESNKLDSLIKIEANKIVEEFIAESNLLKTNNKIFN